ncbi:hypothetical protein CLG96_02100 [Sphingomonas oleivorans]|uniref:DUF3168 domain-containing protein n=1 Tax=Sphingomonas oleivorans TaxID=1735121 RepID=A0A2T5G1C5_9SPHN|nr:DUF3168 domain-containing protein [Sphingomonas oleivorans]PTQ12957.1 hypothetical protein CLG96_02100 [Sphingomonas oleivorans]
MSALEGTDIVGALLTADAQLTELVPADRIKAGRLPEGVGLPALLVRTVSSVDRQPLTRGPLVRRTDRVSVTVHAASHRDRKAVIALVRKCCAGRTGALGGGSNVSILTAGMGPDLNGPGDIFARTQDFRVSWDAED